MSRLLALAALVLAACGDGGPASPVASPTPDPESFSGGPEPSAEADLGPDPESSADLPESSPEPDPGPSTGPDPGAPDDDPESSSGEPEPDVSPDPESSPAPDPEASDWLCDLEMRLEACEAALLDPAPMPESGGDLLYYVNRAWPIPSDWPISETSTWNPCLGGDPGVPNDLVCVPAKYSTKDLSLRQVAWESEAPPGWIATHDGLPVGREGMVGFRAAFDAALEEAGEELFIASAYRSYAIQEATFQGHVDKEIGKGLSPKEAELLASTYSARPGHSEHQLGTTADLVYRLPDGSISSFSTKIAKTLHASGAFTWMRANAHRFGIVLTYARHRIDVTQYAWEPWHWRFVGVEAADAMHACSLDTEESLNARYDAGPIPPYEAIDLILYPEAKLLDSSVPGLEAVAPGAAFSRTFAFENSGTTPWWGHVLAHVEGESFGAATDLEVPCTVASETVTVTLDLVAPAAPGLHEGSWRLLDGEGAAIPGGELTVQVFAGDPEDLPAPDLRFVRVVDESGATGGADPGADLDALVLEKTGRPGAVPVFAVAVHAYAPSATVSNDDPADALGPPDAFSGWPDDVSTCLVSGGFASLGGAGDIVLELPLPLAPGDTLTLLEVGACTYAPGKSAFADPVAVYASASAAGPWQLIGEGPGGAMSFLVDGSGP